MCTNKKKIVLKLKNLTHPTARAAAHFIIRDPRLGVRAVIRWNCGSLRAKALNSCNTDQSSIKKSDKQQRFTVLPAESLLLQWLPQWHTSYSSPSSFTPSLTRPASFLLLSLRYQQHTHSSFWHCRPCPRRLTSAASTILSFFYLRSPPNKSELSPNWTFSLFSPRTNCPHPPFPPPFFYSPSPSPPPSLSKCLVNKLNSNCWQFNC